MIFAVRVTQQVHALVHMVSAPKFLKVTRKTWLTLCETSKTVRVDYDVHIDHDTDSTEPETDKITFIFGFKRKMTAKNLNMPF